VFVLGKPFHPSLMFEGKAGAYLSEVPFRYYTRGWAPDVTCKHLARLERLAMDKEPSLLPKCVNYGQKMFYNIGPRSELKKNFHQNSHAQYFGWGALLIQQRGLFKLTLFS
jgi:hypothetical protein